MDTSVGATVFTAFESKRSLAWDKTIVSDLETLSAGTARTRCNGGADEGGGDVTGDGRYGKCCPKPYTLNPEP
jgi:hypothetical protein